MSKSRDAQGRSRQSRMAKGARKTYDGLYLQKDAEDMEFELMDRVYAFNVDVLEADTGDPSMGLLQSFSSLIYIMMPTAGLTYKNKIFKTGDDVILNSHFDDTNDIWLGRISQIRTSKDKTQTLAKVRWYWSRNDVASRIKSFDYTKCSPYERILSDDYDYVSPYAFQAHAHIYEYHEDDLNPPPIGPTSFFIRTTLLYRKRQIKPPLGHNTCSCKEAYNPYPAAMSTDEIMATTSPREPPDTMHFCPSINCRKWFHSNCLALMQHLDTTSHPMTRAIRLLANDPDSEAPFVMFGHFAEPESREIVPDSTEQMTVYDALELWTRKRSILAHLPPALLAIAQAPIVRRAGGAPGSGGWAIGNVADVVLARRFVYAALEHGGAPERSARFLELLRRDAARWEDVFWLERRRLLLSEEADVEMRDQEGATVTAMPLLLPGGGRDTLGVGESTAATAMAWGGLWDGVNLQEDSDCGEEHEDGRAHAVEGPGTASIFAGSLRKGKSGKSGAEPREPDEISALEALCEDLGQFDLLASPYAPYWERRWREFEEAAVAGLFDSLDFVCPQCRSAI